MKIAAIDWGKDIIGILDMEDNSYHPFYKNDKPKAIKELVKFDVLVTFAGEGADIPNIESETGKSMKESGFKGIHIDMSEVCYPNVRGSDLYDTYHKNLNSGRYPCDKLKILTGTYTVIGRPSSDDDLESVEHYINRNWSDCFQAMSLFYSWVKNDLDGEVYCSDKLAADFGLENVKLFNYN